jgi:hypothetical protein
VHQSDIGAVPGRTSIEIDALEKRTRAVPNPNYGNSDFVHCSKNSKLAVAPRLEQESCHNIAIFDRRNPEDKQLQMKAGSYTPGASKEPGSRDFD